MSNYTFIQGGSVNKAFLQIVPRKHENQDGTMNAKEAAMRLLHAADTLGENEYIGLEFSSWSDRYDMELYTCTGIELEKEDIDWLMTDCAKSGIVRERTLHEVFEEEATVYALCSTEDLHNPVESGVENSLEYFGQLVDMFRKTNGIVRITIERYSAKEPPRITVFLTLWENLSFRVKTMISAAMPGLMVRGVTCNPCDIDLAEYKCGRNNCIDIFEKLLIKLMDIEGVIDEEQRIDEEINSLQEFIKEKAQDYTLERYDMDDGTSIESLNLSVRTINCLRRASVNTLGDLKRISDYDLIKIRNLGKRGYCEIKALLLKLEYMADHNEEDLADEFNYEEQYAETQCELLESVIPELTEEAGKEDSEEKTEQFEDCMHELDKLIGLDEVKTQIKRIVAFAHMQKDMQSNGIESVPVVLNMEFTGNPGTAKTTVARILAKLFYSIGIVTSKDIVEVGRADLVAEYVGHTAIKVKKVFAKSKGKLLFIDEAYSLFDSQRSSFADEAISTIVQEMENRRNDTIVIFAGYPDRMEEFFSMNPGLRSRVPFSITFKDYTADEMVQIAELEAEKRGFSIDESSKPRLLTICDEAVQNPESGNGRFCRNLIENAILDYAVRVYGSDVEKEKNYILCEENFGHLFSSETGAPSEPEHKQIGFII